MRLSIAHSCGPTSTRAQSQPELPDPGKPELELTRECGYVGTRLRYRVASHHL